MMSYMGWESPGGTTHFTPPNFQYDTSCYPMVITPPNGTVEAGPPPPHCLQPPDNGRGQQTVHFHVKQAEAVSLQLGGQVNRSGIYTRTNNE